MTSELIRALRAVPEKRLRLIELARELVKEDGTLDFDRAGFLRQELDQAIAEAEAYARATKEVVWALRQLARS